jgi:molybdopterin-binding protein
MPRKQQGWITFQSSETEQQLLEQYCQQSQRTKTEILRELIRTLHPPLPQPLSAQSEPPETEEPVEPIVLKAMKVSARNVFRGKVKRVVLGAVNAEVTLEIAPGVELVSNITRASAEHLELSEGKEAYAVIKSSSVMIAQE